MKSHSDFKTVWQTLVLRIFEFSLLKIRELFSENQLECTAEKEETARFTSAIIPLGKLSNISHRSRASLPRATCRSREASARNAIDFEAGHSPSINRSGTSQLHRIIEEVPVNFARTRANTSAF